ncbi:MAG: protein phosphatase 2C domain-containing protein [Chloroflexota bacterium]
MFNFLKKIISGNKTNPTNPRPIMETVQTAPLSDEQLQVVSIPSVSMSPLHFLVGCGQSVGRQRDHNEDALYSLATVLSDGNNEIPFGLFVIADGMGGYEHGELASSAAARTLAETVLTRIYIPHIGLEGESSGDSIQEIMDSAVTRAHQAVSKRAPGGGTTLTAALAIGEQVTITHVGDSRAYFIFPDGRMQLITQDHSLVRRLVELGQITEQEAAVHPNRNVLYRALGQVEPFRPDIHTLPMPHPGYLMICSDGLWGVVNEAEIFQIIASARNPSVACKNLVDAANIAGGPDNISVILVQYF